METSRSAVHSGHATIYQQPGFRAMQPQPTNFRANEAPVHFNGRVASGQSKSHFGQNTQNNPQKIPPAPPQYFGTLPVPQPTLTHSSGPRFGNPATYNASNSTASATTRNPASGLSQSFAPQSNAHSPYPTQLSPKTRFVDPIPARPRLSWQETVICNNVDAASLRPPPPERQVRLPTPPATQSAASSYAPSQKPKAVHVLNRTQQPPADPSVPFHRSQLEIPVSPSRDSAPSLPPSPRLGDTSGIVNKDTSDAANDASDMFSKDMSDEIDDDKAQAAGGTKKRARAISSSFGAKE